ncbi:MAG: hypothetical protein IKN52_18250 [Victivallales bacterium]|nr:hypothetical protein [Victivallales bacterium]
MRVELRQVGVRDEASILGGVGTCGRPFCCAKFLNSFNSINVKMAKQQGLSLNPQNISGCCGRLKCCLQFEAEIYKEISAEASQKQEEEATDDAVADMNELDDAQAVQLEPLREEEPVARFQRPQQQGGNRQQQRPRNNNGQNTNQQRQNNGNNNQQRRFDGPQNNRSNNNNRPRNNNNNNNNGNGQQQRPHKNPPTRPMPPPDKQVKHPLPPEGES